jgi:hypothetical protein
MRAIAQRRGVSLPPESARLADAERRALAIELELAEIRERVTATLHNRLSKIPDLAARLANYQQSEKIFAAVEQAAEQAIGGEFGLNVKLRGVRRLDTATDITAGMQRDADQNFLRNAADQNAKSSLEQDRLKRAAVDSNMVKMIATLGEEERQIVRDADDPRAAEIRQKAQRSVERIDAAPPVTIEAAAARLKRAPVDAAQLLPWEQTVISPADSVASNDNPR